MSRRPAAMLALVLAVACVRQAALSPPPEALRTLAVAAPRNQTGNELPVAADSILELLGLGRTRVSVPDLLGAETRTLLGERGFVLVPPEDETAPTLQLVIERWEPETPSLSFVLVTVGASLLEPPAGRVLWSVRRVRWMVPTRGAPTAATASAMAARTVVHTLFAEWIPGQTS
jgi:hypothetical protein